MLGSQPHGPSLFGVWGSVHEGLEPSLCTAVHALCGEFNLVHISRIHSCVYHRLCRGTGSRRPCSYSQNAARVHWAVLKFTVIELRE